MDFSEGGYWHYAMIDPDGKEYWGRMDYIKIKPVENYSGMDGFCDDSAVLNPELPRSFWDVTFTGQGESAMVQTIVTYKSLSDLETVLEMGMKEGLTSTLERLDALLLELNK